MLPLEGLKIVDLSQGQQGPHAAVLLSDMGADVIKVEPRQGELGRGVRMSRRLDPVGGGASPTQALLLAHDRNKRGIVLDLTKDRGKEIIYKLAENSDVLLHNFRPGVMERMGLGYAVVSQYNKGIIYATASGYGPKGPGAGRRALDIAGQASGGIMMQTGAPGGPPVPVGAAVADQAGAMLLAFGIMVAIYVRERTGQGQEVDVSLLGAQMTLQAWELTYHLLTGQLPPRDPRGLGLVGGLWRIFKAQDRWLALAGVDDEHWAPFCEALGLKNLLRDKRFSSAEGRVEHRDDLVAILDEHFAKRPLAYWLKALEAADVVVAPVNSYADLLQDPQVIENEYITELKLPDGKAQKVVGVPVKLSKTPGRPQAPAPEVGQHTNEVLLQLGYSWDDIAKLIEEGVV
ncbi:MAG: CoA transferase [Chloroflexi bacterium]|nr:CoA transferase [Chloroflexota bacterium]